MYGYGYYGATAPTPVPYEKQTDEFLIGILNQYAPKLKELAAKIANPATTAAQKTALKAEETKILTSYWEPARKNLIARGYTVAVVSGALKITPPAKKEVSVSSGGPNMLLILAAAGAAAYWWFVVRKKSSPGLSALQSE